MARLHRRQVMSRLAIFATLAVALSGCESLLAARAHSHYPVQGQLVDIGQRNLQLNCQGTGSPTVVLESGGDMFGSLAWFKVQSPIATTTRACSYSRAGIMWSDVRAGPPAPDDIAQDLHAALAVAGERPPYVLVGQSRGGIYNLIFTGLFADDVAGLVFVDSAHPDQVARYAQAGLTLDEGLPASVRVGLALRWTGIPRLVSNRFALPSAPESINGAFKAYFPQSLTGYESEKNALDLARTRALQFSELGSRPTIVLTRKLPTSAIPSDAASRVRQERWETIWRQLHAEIARWSTRGEQRVIADSDHGMQFSQPGAVIAAVNDVVTAVRTVQSRASVNLRVAAPSGPNPGLPYTTNPAQK